MANADNGAQVYLLMGEQNDEQPKRQQQHSDENQQQVSSMANDKQRSTTTAAAAAAQAQRADAQQTSSLSRPKFEVQAQVKSALFSGSRFALSDQRHSMGCDELIGLTNLKLNDSSESPPTASSRHHKGAQLKSSSSSVLLLLSPSTSSLSTSNSASTCSLATTNRGNLIWAPTGKGQLQESRAKWMGSIKRAASEQQVSGRGMELQQAQQEMAHEQAHLAEVNFYPLPPQAAAPVAPSGQQQDQIMYANYSANYNQSGDNFDQLANSNSNYSQNLQNCYLYPNNRDNQEAHYEHSIELDVNLVGNSLQAQHEVSLSSTAIEGDQLEFPDYLELKPPRNQLQQADSHAHLNKHQHHHHLHHHHLHNHHLHHHHQLQQQQQQQQQQLYIEAPNLISLNSSPVLLTGETNYPEPELPESVIRVNDQRAVYCQPPGSSPAPALVAPTNSHSGASLQQQQQQHDSGHVSAMSCCLDSSAGCSNSAELVDSGSGMLILSGDVIGNEQNQLIGQLEGERQPGEEEQQQNYQHQPLNCLANSTSNFNCSPQFHSNQAEPIKHYHHHPHPHPHPHQRSMSEPELKVCEWEGCENTFMDMQEFVKHLEDRHVNQTPMEKNRYYCMWSKCKRNSQEFNARYKLLIHMRVHSGEKPYPCNNKDCKKSFSRLENLKIHVRSHTGEKPYRCTFDKCPKEFTNSSDRIKHHKTHRDPKPYACTFAECAKRYTDPSSLRKHLRAHRRSQVQVSGPTQQVESSTSAATICCSADFDPASLFENEQEDSGNWQLRPLMGEQRAWQQQLSHSWCAGASSQFAHLTLAQSDPREPHLVRPAQRTICRPADEYGSASRSFHGGQVRQFEQQQQQQYNPLQRTFRQPQQQQHLEYHRWQQQPAIEQCSGLELAAQVLEEDANCGSWLDLEQTRGRQVD